MIPYKSLTEVKESFHDFMINAMKYNLHVANSDDSLKDFYCYTEGLSLFGQLLSYSQLPKSTKLYFWKTGGFHDENFRLKYYAIDRSGLTHGYIFGPPTEIYKNYLDLGINNLLGVRDRYYGCDVHQRNTFVYDCVDKMFSKRSEYPKSVDVELLRKEYLPLEEFKKFDYSLDQGYFKVYKEISFDNRICNKVIYKTDHRSFYLPIEELVS